MKAFNKLSLAFLILMFLFFTNIRLGSAQKSSDLSLDSVIILLTSEAWYDSYSGDLPLTETYFTHIIGTIDSIQWEDTGFRLIRSEINITGDSAWVLQPNTGNGTSYEITLLDKDNLQLNPIVIDGISSTYSHKKPQPAPSEAKSKFIESITGDWSVAKVSTNHQYQNITRVNFAMSNTSPDTITYAGYNDNSLLWSEKYKIILVYQKNWFLIKDNSHGYFLSYKDGFLFNVMAGASEFEGETSLYIKQISPAGKAEYSSINNRFDLFPNPCNNFFSINSDANIEKIEILGLNGQLLMTKNPNEKGENTIDISTLSKGVYLVKGFSNNKCFSSKLIKQ
jgi:hypothetical protein